MERWICIHGHFHQPSRENPWLDAVEMQDSAAPYHDWNERILAECYAPNAVARMMDDHGRIVNIINTYARMSFSIGPALLNWMKQHANETYCAIQDADRQSQERYGGHGSALAQAYTHLILPLASRRDKETQIHWGIQDFLYHFGRRPVGMWLPDTAVDLETLDILAHHGIRFTILAPHQARRVRPLAAEEWTEVSATTLDPTMPYLQHTPSGQSIVIFFYDAPITKAVMSEGLLSNGERFAQRLMGAFDESCERAQLVHIATDGEVYGHHQRHGDMALAYALHYIEQRGESRLTNYGEFLEHHPPTYAVEIAERTSRHCIHGIERWYRDCGCKVVKHRAWSQAWRTPLRDACDWLRDTLSPRYEEFGQTLLADPWAARDDYIHVILDRSPSNVAAFLSRHATHELTYQDEVTVLHLLELQRQMLLMYTSSGWFYDDISGVESIQVIMHAGRALHLARIIFGAAHDPNQDAPSWVSVCEDEFLSRLQQAKSNLTEHRDGRAIYEKWVRPAEVDLAKVAAHYAVSSLFERYPNETDIYCYHLRVGDYRQFEPGMAKVIVGYAQVMSHITHETQTLMFGVLHFGDHTVNAGVQPFTDETTYQSLVHHVADAAERGDVAEVIRLMDRAFGGMAYSVHSLFRRAQRTFLDMMLESTLADDEAMYRRIYERRAPMMQLLSSLNTPLPKTMLATAEFIINTDLRRALQQLPPDNDYIGTLFERAFAWDIWIDRQGLTYAFQHAIEDQVDELRKRPDDLEALRHLDMAVKVAHSLPLEVNFWKVQNTYYELSQTIYVEMQERADEGEESAHNWVEHFLLLGEKLGVNVTEMKHVGSAATIASLTHEVLSQRHTPLATYRIQFNPSFSFADAAAIVPYLHDLGISHCYASPIFQPRTGSTHGYDVCDHRRINHVLGGEAGFDALSQTLHAHGMSILLDIVPNHMGIGDTGNIWWMDVLENGPGSQYASYFDIAWKPVKPELAGKVLLPTLGDQYGRVLERGELRLVYEDGAFSVHYYDKQFPISPDTYHHILGHQLDTLTNTLGEDHADLHEFQSILTAISYLPSRSESDADRLEERNREKEVIKRRIAALYQQNAAVAASIDAVVHIFNGTVGDAASFDLLDDLLNMQAYRLAFWRVAAEEINYRRFFDINELAAIRPEEEEVFEATHELIFRLLTKGTVTGLRLDHIDGLYDPFGYLWQLQERYLFYTVKDRLAKVRTTMPNDETLAARVHARLTDWVAEQGESPAWPLYVVAEKILSEDEPLPRNWAVSGTSGYDFLISANNLFVDTRNRDAFDALYRGFTGQLVAFDQMVNTNKKMIMLVSMASEIYALAHQLERIAERNRLYRDFTLDTLSFAMREVIAGLTVYRTYITDAETVTPRDRRYIEEAIGEAKRRNPRTAAVVFDFIRDTLLLANLPNFRLDDQAMLIHWVRKFQQVSGPVMAKGVEDTSFYVYNRLMSLNEVGGHPHQFGHDPPAFHESNLVNQRAWPLTMLASSTHDTKRSEDVRARINILSEMPEEWETAINRWATMNATKKTIHAHEEAPDRNDEYLLYQNLIGAWPVYGNTLDDGHISTSEWANFRERMRDYMQKATKEAKVHTSWVNANEAYDTAVHDFVLGILSDDQDDPFVADIRAYARRVATFGRYTSLSQMLLKLTSPGVPDIYQGNELWDFSLVDPDNRRPVDFVRRRDMLAALKEQIASASPDLRPLVHELLEQSWDARIKLYVLYQTLQFRRAHRTLFESGSYVPLDIYGTQAIHGCAFARTSDDTSVVVVVPRLLLQLTDGIERPPLGNDVWKETWVMLSHESVGARYHHVLTGETLVVEEFHGQPGLALAAVFGVCPVALLARVTEE